MAEDWEAFYMRKQDGFVLGILEQVVRPKRSCFFTTESIAVIEKGLLQAVWLKPGLIISV